jgi:hypothetical protein
MYVEDAMKVMTGQLVMKRISIFLGWKDVTTTITTAAAAAAAAASTTNRRREITP